METAVVSTDARLPNGEQSNLPLVGLASTIAFVAAASLLGYSFISKKRRLPVLGQLCLGVLAGCAGVVTWSKRQEEAEAARHLIGHIHEVRDNRWLKKHPVAYG